MQLTSPSAFDVAESTQSTRSPMASGDFMFLSWHIQSDNPPAIKLQIIAGCVDILKGLCLQKSQIYVFVSIFRRNLSPYLHMMSAQIVHSV